MASSFAFTRAPAASPGTPVTTAPAAYTTQCPPPCPACGGLECLCRPRFFPGQVLTDDDLNNLENYVIAKNRLHNRYFHGAGVVCGLEVVCDACNTGNVTVNPGYALSPCGDDIIVCKPASVSICDLINKCKPPQDNCDPYSSFQQPMDCKQGVQQWVLSICYQETASRGVQPLMSQPCSCKGSCGCGGNCSGSCGCNSAPAASGSCGCGTKSTAATPSMSSAAKKYTPQCEPTLICEGFTFTATRYVDPKAQQRTDLSRYGALAVLASKSAQLGPLMSQLLACYLQAAAIRDAYSDQQIDANTSEDSLIQSYSDYAAALRDFAAEHAVHHCDLARQLLCLDLTPPVQIDPATGLRKSAALKQLSPTVLWQARFKSLDDLTMDLFQDCFCSALLPPCPDVQGGNCVPLALITINTDTCVVTEVCNWSAREFALTLPSLFYWTSFINWGAIKNVIAQLCCGQPNSRVWVELFDLFAAIVKNNSASLAKADNSAALTMQALGGFLQTATMPDGTARLLNVTQGQRANAASSNVDDLRAAIATLQRTVQTQSSQIEQLMKGR